MPWTLVQKSASATFGGGTTVAPSLPGASAAGNLLIGPVVDVDEAATVTGPSGWQLAVLGTQAFAGSTGLWYYLDNPGGISSATFSDATGNTADAWLAEFTAPGVAGAVLKSSGTGSAGSGTSCTATATSANLAGDLGIALFAELALSSITWSTPSGWTQIGNDTGSGTAMSAYLLSASAGALSVTGSTATGPSGQWAAAVATFSVSGGGSPAVNASAFMTFF